MIQLVSVNVATPSVLGQVNGERVWSGILKSPVDTASSLWLSDINLSGDGQADLEVHGGLDKAVYAYPSEHFAGWSLELGESLGAAPFGENLSTLGVLEQEARIGDVWEWGTAVLQVTQPRWPCYKLVLHRGRPDVQSGCCHLAGPAGTCACSGPVRFRRAGQSWWPPEIHRP